MKPSSPAWKSFRSLAVLGLLAVAGCSNDPLHLGTAQQRQEPFVNGSSASTRFRALAIPAVLTRVDSASSPEFDRVVFSFSGKNLPGFWFQPKPAKPGAPASFEMRFGARGILTNGQLAIAPKDQRRSPGYPVLKGLAQAKVGEESTLWQADLAKQSDYRVIELQNPPRIIVDFKR